MVSFAQRDWANVFDFLLGGARVDYFQGGKHWAGLGVFMRNDAVWYTEGILPVFHLARITADEFIRCDYASY